MTSERAESPEPDHQVLPFRRRGAPAAGAYRMPRPAAEPHAGPPHDLAKYEGGAVEDNYRHRMLVNLAGLAFTVVLALAGAWLAVTIADMRKNQDCYLSGRRNCAPIDVPSLQDK